MSDGSSMVGLVRPKRLIRKFDADWRLQVVAQSFAAGATVRAVARQHGVRSNLLSYWRKRYGDAARASAASAATAPALIPRFSRVTVDPSPRPSVRAPTSSWIEIDLATGTLRLVGAVSAAQLRDVLTAVR